MKRRAVVARLAIVTLVQLFIDIYTAHLETPPKA